MKIAIYNGQFGEKSLCKLISQSDKTGLSIIEFEGYRGLCGSYLLTVLADHEVAQAMCELGYSQGELA